MDVRNLSQHMAELARSLGDDATAEATQQTIVDSAVRLIGPCEAAGITLAGRQGEIRSTAVTSETATRSDVIQQEEGEGPCTDAVWVQQVVRVPDLREENRWPKWSARTLQETGVRSMLCVQLFTHVDRVGALNLFSSLPQAFDEDAEEEAIAVAAHAAVAVAAAENIEGLKVSVNSRTVIGAAIGMVMVQYGLTDTRAFDFLKRLSSYQNRKLVLIARDLVDDWNARQKYP